MDRWMDKHMTGLTREGPMCARESGLWSEVQALPIMELDGHL